MQATDLEDESGMAEKESNLKYFNYRHQSARLKQMIEGKCFFEAMVIEDAIIEDRLMSCRATS